MSHSALQTLRSYAETASLHASQQLGLPLADKDIDAFLEVLRRLPAASDPSTPLPDLQALSLVYGAWLGQWLCSTCGGRWIGLSEPVAPRVRVGGLVVSPIDAVGRELSDSSQPPLSDLIDRLASLSPDTPAVLRHNTAAWDRLSALPRYSNPDALPSSPEEAIASLDPWLAEFGVADRDLLCLAAGGGTHGVLFAMAGARVTVVDISPRQLAIDQSLADQAGVVIATHCGSMDDLSEFQRASFDAVIQPVSTCYLADLTPLFSEVARVTKPGGIYVSQHKQSPALRATLGPDGVHVLTPERVETPVPTGESVSLLHDPETLEFAHPLEAILGGICRHGFVIEDVSEPLRADAWAPWDGTPEEAAAYQAHFLAPYLKVKARRR